MSEENKPLPWDAIIHASAGILALVAGGLMYSYTWALVLFSGLMILSGVSAIIISWRDDAWVPGHFLAMLPVIGVVCGLLAVPYAFTFAYVCLWLAFIHFVYRGYIKIQEAKAGGETS
jgi:uncharacterized membrane protein HdeD (DUF308 family)